MKNIKTIIILLIVAVLGYFVFTKIGTEKSSMSKEALSDFAVIDTASVDKIKLSDTQGKVMEFSKTNNIWTLGEGECVQQHMIYLMLETFKYISVKGPVPKGAVENMNKQIMLHHKKVQIFQNGKLSKTWFIGNATQDHLGTYMILQDPEKGKSPEPFIMFLPNVFGTLGDQFSANPLDYVCSEIFTYDPLSIKEVNVEIPDSSHLNFRIVALDKNSFELYNNEQKVELFDTAAVRFYLTGFRKIHFELHNRTASESDIDSMKNTTPYYKIAVTNKQGDVNAIKAYKKYPAFTRYDFNGELIKYDLDKLWVFNRRDELTVCQYYVFDKLLREINFFKLPE